MIDKENIARAAEEALAEIGNTDLFVVEARVLPGDEVEVAIDSDGRGTDGRVRGVSVEDCIALSRAIESRFDRDEEDFSLTVSSAGIGQPLKALRQYRKLLGRSVEVVLNSGAKLVAVLDGIEQSADESGANITLSYDEKQKAEGKKRPGIVTVTRTFALADIKTTKEHIDFK